MDNLLNIKSNWKIIQMEALIKDNDPSQDLARSSLFEREVQVAQNITNWKEVQLSLLDLQKKDETPTATSFQARYSDETAKILKEVQSDIMDQLSLKRLKVNYMVLLLQKNYYNHLIEMRNQENTKKAISQETETDMKIDMPDIARLLVEMMLTNPECIELKRIYRLLLNWKSHQ